MDKQTSTTPRICEEDNRAECERFTQPLESTFEKTPQLSSRADKVGVAIHKSTQVDSSGDYSASAESMDCHANASAFARNDDKKADSSNEAQNLSEQAKDSKILELESGFCEPCKAESPKTPQNAGAENVFCSQADRRQDFGARIGVLQGDSRAHTWVYVTAESPQQSTILAQKPTPTPSQA